MGASPREIQVSYDVGNEFFPPLARSRHESPRDAERPSRRTPPRRPNATEPSPRHPTEFGLLLALALAGTRCAAPAPASAPTVDLSASGAASAPPSSTVAAPARRATFRVDPAASTITFTMDAPLEKIRGRLPVDHGSLQIDPDDLGRTIGEVVVDLGRIELFHARAADLGAFGAEEKSAMQNEHARAWLEISNDAPSEIRRDNSLAALTITRVSSASGGEGEPRGGARVTATGDLALHGKRLPRTMELDVRFVVDAGGGAPSSVVVRTIHPFSIGLAEYDIAPREAFARLASKTLDTLAPKVANEARVSVELVAKRDAP